MFRHTVAAMLYGAALVFVFIGVLGNTALGIISWTLLGAFVGFIARVIDPEFQISESER